MTLAFACFQAMIERL